MECKVWSVKCKVWSVKRKVWSVEGRVWSVVCGVLSVECGVQSVECRIYQQNFQSWLAIPYTHRDMPVLASVLHGPERMGTQSPLTSSQQHLGLKGDAGKHGS